MMNFDDSWTTVKVLISEDTLSQLNNSSTKIKITHTGWKSSEDWQLAKEWHEIEFWPSKFEKLTQLLAEQS